MLNEITKCMIQTPYGVLTMDADVFSRFAVASEEMQWIQLYKVSMRGEHTKAAAMQWFWSEKVKADLRRMN